MVIYCQNVERQLRQPQLRIFLLAVPHRNISRHAFPKLAVPHSLPFPIRPFVPQHGGQKTFPSALKVVYSRKNTMSVTIRRAVATDLPALLHIFSTARQFMASNGNPTQWVDGYPQASFMAEEIGRGHCYVCLSDSRIVGTFCLVPCPDPTYSEIYNGHWLNDKPYQVIHRLASDGTVRGIAKACIDWCATRCPNLRLDTHADNHLMQSLAEKYGFERVGNIRVANCSWRIAYHRTTD